MSNHFDRPTIRKEKWITQDLIDPNIQKQNWISIEQQTFQSEDYWIQFGQLTYDFVFYSISYIVKQTALSGKEDKDVVFKNVYTFDQDNLNFNRISYNLMDVLGDIGGVYQLLVQMFGFFLFRISNHAFKLLAIKNLFFV
jgi:hypothetical protein